MSIKQENQPYVLNEKAATQYISMLVSYLQKDLLNGELLGRTSGPRHAKFGKRIVYFRQDLDASWLQAHIVSHN